MLLNTKIKLIVTTMLLMLVTTSCIAETTSLATEDVMTANLNENDSQIDELNTLKKGSQETEDIKENITEEESKEESKVESKEENEEESKEEIKKIVDTMTIEEKVGQMFIVVPEVFTNGLDITSIDNINTKKMETYNIGGLVMFSKNIVNPEQITKLNQDLLNFDSSLFISVDEEGGQVARIAGNSNFPEEDMKNMSSVYAGDFQTGYEIGDTIGAYLKKYNFNLDYAPVVDVLLNSSNTVVNKRSFGSDAHIVSGMATNVLQGLRNNNILASAKHFPGHGNTALDTHFGFATSNATLEEMKEVELVPFEAMIENNVDMMMISHVIYPHLSDNEVPATLNKDIVTGLLKEEMGYTGVIITDAMNMGAIADNFSIEESTVQAVLAGNDIILMPSDFYLSYQSLVAAVKSGRITEERIDESVIKILTLKSKL